MDKKYLQSLGIKPFYNFEALVIGPHNEFAAKACQSVAKSPGETYNPLYIYGPPGVGKTHLMHSVAQDILKTNPEAKIKYLSAERLMSDIISAIGEDKVMAVRKELGEVDLLIIDDIHYLVESRASQEELLHIFNTMTEMNNQTIIASNCAPQALKGFTEELKSRFSGGLVADVKMPDVKMRVEILRHKQKSQDLAIPDELLLFVAERLNSTVRELEGFLKRMHAYVHLSHMDVNEELVQSVIREISPTGASGVARDPLLEGTSPGESMEKAAPPPNPKPEKLEKISDSDPPLENPPRVGKNGKSKEDKPSDIDQDDILEISEEERPNPKKPPKTSPAVNGKTAAVPHPEKSGKLAAKKSSEKSGAAVPEEEEAPVEIPAPIPDPTEDESREPLPSGFKEVGAVFFYPRSCDKEIESVNQKFQEVIKKHKLKFRLKKVHIEPYETSAKINYSSFVDVCKTNRVPVAIVLGPPSHLQLPEQDFYDLLSVTLDVQGISLQLINYNELDKDYRYLNLALDIALVRTR